MRCRADCGGHNTLGGDGGASEAERASITNILPSGCTVVAGPVNGVFVRQEGNTLAVYGDPSGRQGAADLVLLTESRADVTWAARGLARGGAQVVAPEKGTALLEHPERFWAEWREKRFHDYARQSARVASEPLRVSRAVKEGDSIQWAGHQLRVLETPGYTRDAVTYLLEVGGKSLAFTGDLIREEGKIQDLFNLQDAIPAAKIGGYHGWAGRLGDLMASLDRLAAEKPDVVIPARGPVISDPAAIRRLQARVRAVYANYLSIDALRWYFKDEHIFRASVHAPAGFKVSDIAPASIAAEREGAFQFTVQVPGDIRPGIYGVSADVSWEAAELRDWAQGAIEVVRP